MIILALQDVKKSFGTHEVLKSVSFTLQDGERMGLVGVNGSGKSTLMKIIAGLESADGGTVSMQKGLRIGYLAQQGALTGDETVQETLEGVFEPQRRMEKELRALEQEMAEHGEDPEKLRILGGKYDALTREFERTNGYGWRSAGGRRAGRPETPGIPGDENRAAFRRRTHASVPGPDAADGAGPAAAGRADEPPGPEEHRLAGGISEPPTAARCW